MVRILVMYPNNYFTVCLHVDGIVGKAINELKKMLGDEHPRLQVL